MLTQKELKDLLIYNDKTGEFKWKVGRRKSKKGDIICTNRNGYLYGCINYKVYSLHKLAWLYTHGYLPKEIDHINGIKDDNRLVNLRPCTRVQNCQNRVDTKNKSSGIRNVHWHKGAKKWQVRIKTVTKRLSLGLFDDLELAELVAIEARIKYHGNYAYLGQKV
jgi:hypothetical protein